MNILSLLPTDWLWPAAGLVGLALVSAIGVQTVRLHSAQAELAKVQHAWDRERTVRTQAALEATEKNRAEDQRRTAAQQEITNENQRLALRVRDAAARAALAGDGLRQRTAPIAARCSGSPDHSGLAGASAPAEAPGVVLARVLDRLAGAAGQLAEIADQARIAGLACEKSYDSLSR